MFMFFKEMSPTGISEVYQILDEKHSMQGQHTNYSYHTEEAAIIKEGQEGTKSPHITSVQYCGGYSVDWRLFSTSEG